MRAGLVAALTVVAPRAASGQPRPTPTLTQTALAQALFADGRAAIAAGRVDEACAKFTQSYQVDPSAGTLLNLGICHERQGRLGSAYAELAESVSRAIRDGRPERERLAREHVSAVAPRVARVIVNVGRGADVEGLMVTLDGLPLTRSVWGTAVPVDPGVHAVVATAPGRRTWRGEVSIALDHETQTLEIEPLAGEAAPTPPPSAAPAVAAKPPPVTAAPPGPRPLQRALGWGAIGLGAAAVATGSVFGLLSFTTWDGAKACPNLVCPSAADRTKYERAGTIADVSTVWFVTGAAAVAAGALLVFLAPRADSRAHAWQLSPMVGGRMAGLIVVGAP